MARFLFGLGCGTIGGGLVALFTHGNVPWSIGVGLTICVSIWVSDFVDLMPD